MRRARSGAAAVTVKASGRRWRWPEQRRRRPEARDSAARDSAAGGSRRSAGGLPDSRATPAECSAGGRPAAGARAGAEPGRDARAGPRRNADRRLTSAATPAADRPRCGPGAGAGRRLGADEAATQPREDGGPDVDAEAGQAPQADARPPARQHQGRRERDLRRVRAEGRRTRLDHEPPDRGRSSRDDAPHQARRQGVDQRLSRTSPTPRSRPRREWALARAIPRAGWRWSSPAR